MRKWTNISPFIRSPLVIYDFLQLLRSEFPYTVYEENMIFYFIGVISPGEYIRIHLIRIRIQHFRLNTDPVPDPIRIQGFWWQKIWKNLQPKKMNFFLSNTTLYLSQGLHKGRPSYKKSLQLSKENSTSKHELSELFSTFVGHFCPPESGFRKQIRIRIQWPDWIRIQFGSGPQPWVQQSIRLKIYLIGWRRSLNIYSFRNTFFIVASVMH